MGNIKITEIPGLLKIGIIEFFKFFTEYSKKYIGFLPMIANIIIFVSIGGLYFNILLSKKIVSKTNKIVLLLLLLVSPIILSLVYLLSKLSVHYIMLVSFICVYYMAIILVDYTMEYSDLRTINNIITISILLVSISWGIFANKCYVAFDIKNKNTYSLANRIVSKIDNIDEFNYTEQILILGNRNFGVSKEEFKELTSFTGIEMPRDFNYLGESINYREYFRIILGVELNYPGLDTENKIIDSEEFKAMPNFPDKGSIKKIEGILVVKVSDYVRYGE